MKKMFLLLLLFSGMCFAQSNNEWGEWQKTSCYSKILFRLKYDGKNGEQHKWKAQFKSDYTTVISFNYNINDENGQYTATTHRKVLNPGVTTNDTEAYTATENIYLIVDKVSLSPYPQGYIECE
jgi:hypothetical protein